MTTQVQVIYPLYPLNDVNLSVLLKQVDPTTGKITPLTTGSVVGFLATSNLPTASVADPSLNATVVYTGASGKWLVTIDASVLTPALLNTLFNAATPYLILQLAGGFRVYIQMAYFASRQGTQT